MTEMGWDPYSKNCPSRGLLDRICGRWPILVIGILSSGPRRFNELAEQVDGISQKMLSQTLRYLEEDGLVTRTVIPQVPVRVDYELTEEGRSLCEPVAALEQWVEQHMDYVVTARESYANSQG